MRRTIHPGDAEWPECLSEIEPLDPPEQLRVDGLPLPTDAPSVAVVGTRTPTGAGIEIATMLSRAFAEAGFAVVSGLAVGIDAVAHKAALEAGGHTVAVLGGGLDIDYPKANRDLRRQIEERGTVVTEYDDDVAPAKFTFPGRNRNPMAAGPNELIRTSRADLVTSPSHEAFGVGRRGFPVRDRFKDPSGSPENRAERVAGTAADRQGPDPGNAGEGRRLCGGHLPIVCGGLSTTSSRRSSITRSSMV